MRTRKCYHCGEDIDMDTEKYAVLWLSEEKLYSAFLHEKCSDDPKFETVGSYRVTLTASINEFN